MSLHKLEGPYFEAYKNLVRDMQAPAHTLPINLMKLGQQIAREIMSDALTSNPPVTVTTPQGQQVTGPVPQLPNTLVITTKQEHSYLAHPIKDELGARYSGYLDFGNLRGPEVLTNPPTQTVWPAIGTRIELLVIAKSVLASGCTALALARNAIDRFQPSKVVIASIFYSDQGVEEMLSELPNAMVYVLGQPDRLTTQGMLEPGVGLIEERLPQIAGPLYSQNMEVNNPPSTQFVPDDLMSIVIHRIDELAGQGLSGLTPLETFGLANHYVQTYAAAQSAGTGSPRDLLLSLSLEEAEETLQRIRKPRG